MSSLSRKKKAGGVGMKIIFSYNANGLKKERKEDLF